MKKKMPVVLSVLVALFAFSCNYDPSPVGCSFRVNSIGTFKVAGIKLNGYGADTLATDDRAYIVTALEDGDCPVEFVLNIEVHNMESSGHTLIEKFDWSARIAAGNRQYVADSGEIPERIKVDASQTETICVMVSFNAADLWGDDFTTSEIIDLCLDLGLDDNRIVRNNQHLGRVTVEVGISEDTPHGYIHAESVVIGLDWIQPE
ncbi:MAG: hypothetical protein KAR40_12155 [Candidatus Sabulitectum sp.]|nr:hypothetical protein [Candidatus Sabulitectum sp.]